jgi:hypothetical protein
MSAAHAAHPVAPFAVVSGIDQVSRGRIETEVSTD